MENIMTNKDNMSNETKVVCPVCGTEFAIGEHEHRVKNAVCIGQDSGMGTVYLPVSKRGAVLQAAGIDTSKYFSINLPTGGTQMMKISDNGKAIPVTDDDPIMKAIVEQGTVPNRNLFRRWVMSHVFHGLTYEWGGFSAWLKYHGYRYQWDMLVEEFRVQAKLYGRDMENFAQRNRWFNKELALAMASNYIAQLRKDASRRPEHKCKGVPYVTIDHTHYFVADIERKLIAPLEREAQRIGLANSPKQLYDMVKSWWGHTPRGSQYYNQCPEWKDAYKGMGAYATMQNLLRFHGCHFPKDNDFYNCRLTGLQILENAANAYAGGEGWRLFGLMKQMLDENHIDIEGKIKSWYELKRAKATR